MNTQKRLYRSTQDRMFAGVCGGIAEYLEVDPTLVRLVFVALTLMGGPGLVMYIILMLVVPEQPRQTWKAKNTHPEEETEEPGESIVKSSVPVPDEPLDHEPSGSDE